MALKLQGISFARFSPSSTPELLPGMVDCYRNVFAEPPWNEYKTCSVCGKKWGIGEWTPGINGRNLVHCGELVKDFWPKEMVEQDIIHEIDPEASCWLALGKSDPPQVVGFCWGYPVSPSRLEEKLSLSGFAADLEQKMGVTPDARVAYQDELGVLSDWRSSGIAKELYRKRHQDFLDRGLSVGVVRTKRTPPTVTYLWFQRLGYQIVSEYHDADDRVILSRNLLDLKID